MIILGVMTIVATSINPFRDYYIFLILIVNHFLMEGMYRLFLLLMRWKERKWLKERHGRESMCMAGSTKAMSE